MWCAWKQPSLRKLCHKQSSISGIVDVKIPKFSDVSSPLVSLLSVQSMYIHACMCGCVCNALITSSSVQSMISRLAPSVFSRSSQNLEHRLPGKWGTKRTIYSQNGFNQCACSATTDFHSNEIFPFVNVSARNFSPIFTKFGTRIAKVISKAEFICDRKRKYFTCMRSGRISVFLCHIQYFTSKNNIFHPIFTTFGNQLESVTICNWVLFSTKLEIDRWFGAWATSGFTRVHVIINSSKITQNNFRSPKYATLLRKLWALNLTVAFEFTSDGLLLSW